MAAHATGRSGRSSFHDSRPRAARRAAADASIVAGVSRCLRTSTEPKFPNVTTTAGRIDIATYD
ncbi:uncharacterized protein ChaoS9_250 [Halobacterium phage ChaoS9]|uniref:Uncharacterized protein n=1 Tax=Halobacterium phage ChaoS9 TaxID=2847105 RepID=A0A481V9H8_9CAUD|nr:uncharacterized protein KMC41_gp51 [Halobacterium phage ChaoS9]QBI90055.1 uncharacterized protein ChaoS9_250 [Halobacterium phage ChaoS9]